MKAPIGRLTSLAAALVTAASFLALGTVASAAGTAAGTTITNTATASYGDGTNTYTTTSNTVTSTVQNAPSLTITGSVAKVVTPGTSVTDTFTITNTGNAPTYFQFDSNTGTSSATNATSLTYTIVGAAGGANLTYTQLNNYFLHSDPTASSGNPYTTAAGATQTINVIYTVAVTAPNNTVLTQTLEGGSYQPAVGAAPAANTGAGNNAATGTTVDTVKTDAVLTATKTVSVLGTVAAPKVDYTIGGYNSGQQNSALIALPILQSLNNGTNPAFAAAGYLITDKLPTTTNGTKLTLDTAFTITTTQPASGCTSAVVYSANATSGWTTLNSGTVNYIGLYVYGASCVLVSGASANQISMTFQLNGSVTAGDANATAVKNIANGIIGTQAGTLYGPFTDGSSPANTAGNTAALTGANSPIGQSTVVGTTKGEADVTSAASPSSYALFLGPYIASDATFKGANSAGSYNGVAAVNTSNDFTAVLLPTVGGNTFASTLATYTGPASETFTGATITMPGTPTVVFVQQSVYNNSNAADTYAITGALNGTWPASTTITFNSTASTVGAQASGSYVVPSVAAGGTGSFYAIYTIPAGATVTAFNQYDSTVSATSVNDPSGTKANNPTHNDLYAGGFVALGKYATYTSDNCTTASVTVASPLPGGCILYNLVYKNVAPSTGGTGSSGNVSLIAKGLTLSDDGRSDTTNGWYAGAALTSVPTIGIATAPGDVVVTGTALSAASTINYFTYNFGGSAYGTASTTFSAPVPAASAASAGSTSSGPAKVTVLVGGTATYAINPQDHGVFTFKAQVRGF